MKEHSYKLTTKWTGNTGNGTSDYRSYQRDYEISANNKYVITGSSDPAFRGDKTKYNPEELLVAALSSCHMLWFLHLCAEGGIVVAEYIDNPTGIMTETATGSGQFKEVTLNPTVTITDKNMLDKLDALHEKAHEYCFIANSVNFPVLLKTAANVLQIL
ncbi:MAG: OsmC family protein [Chitinophagaceae bacterium]|jgi:organic hydroperoxide reductase OsmC/OhrA|nr:OsmC family protein [Chitinophagaceae bacterium]